MLNELPMRFVVFFFVWAVSSVTLSADSALGPRAEVAAFFAIDGKVVAWPMFSVSPTGTVERKEEGSAEETFKSPPCMPSDLQNFEKNGECKTQLSAPTKFYEMGSTPPIWVDSHGKTHKPLAGYFIKARAGGPDTVMGFLLQSDAKVMPQKPIAVSNQRNIHAVLSSKKLNSINQFPELIGVLKQWRENHSGTCLRAAEKLTKHANITGEILEYKLPSGRRLQRFVGGSSLGTISPPAKTVSECSYEGGGLNIDLWRVIETNVNVTKLLTPPADGIQFVPSDCDTQCPGSKAYEALEVNGAVFLVGEGFGGTAGGFDAIKLDGNSLVRFAYFFTEGS